MALVALVVMRVSLVLGMADVVKARNVNVRPIVVIRRLVFAARSVRMGHHRHLAGEVCHHQQGNSAAVCHQQLKSHAKL